MFLIVQLPFVPIVARQCESDPSCDLWPCVSACDDKTAKGTKTASAVYTSAPLFR